MGIELLDVEDLKALDVIQSNYPKDASTCCTKMFQLWLDRQPEASWEQLIQALRELNMFDPANTIEQKLIMISNKGKLFISDVDSYKLTFKSCQWNLSNIYNIIAV